MRHPLLALSAFLLPAALIACGSSGGGSGGAGGGAGGSVSTSSSSSSSSTSGSGGSTSSSTSTSTSSSSGSGGAAGGACTNMADFAIVQMKDVATIAADCAKAHFGDDAATAMCIKMATDLSDPCIVCFTDTINCAIMNCAGMCLADSAGAACKSCRAQFCDPAFAMCSGLPQ